MSKVVYFRLGIAPLPTPRPRARVVTPKGRRPIATFYSPAAYKEWQAEAAKALSECEGAEVVGPCAVVVKCFAARPKTTKLDAPKPDVDNYAKGVLDAITKDGRFWNDDCQVTDLFVSKRWTAGDPYIDVSITPLSVLD